MGNRGFPVPVIGLGYWVSGPSDGKQVFTPITNNGAPLTVFVPKPLDQMTLRFWSKGGESTHKGRSGQAYGRPISKDWNGGKRSSLWTGL
jgi:hypothetical protein